MSPVCRTVYARRVARSAAGAVVAVGGAMVLAIAAQIGLNSGLGGPVETEGRLTEALWGVWSLALVAYILARRWARARFESVLIAQLAPTGEPFGDLERARRVGPVDVGLQLARGRERASVWLPLAGLGVSLPLTLHYLGIAALGRAWPDGAGFDSWIAFSAVLVGHCHAALAVLAWDFARRVRSCGEAALVGRAARAGWEAWMWAVALSAVPGACFYGLPLAIVAFTGMFIPIAFASVGARVHGERALLRTVEGM